MATISSTLPCVSAAAISSNRRGASYGGKASPFALARVFRLGHLEVPVRRGQSGRGLSPRGAYRATQLYR